MSDIVLAQKLEFIKIGKLLFDRGLASGAAGNMSMILADNTVVATPTGSSLGALELEKLSILDFDGNLLSGDKPTKEFKFHLALYKNNDKLKATIHLHSTYATAYSCLEDLDINDCIKPFTPYVVMRMGKIPVVPYFKPGSDHITEHLSKLAYGHNAFLLANHGPIACGKTINEALNNIEEFEATCKLYFVLQGNKIRYLTTDEINELRS